MAATVLKFSWARQAAALSAWRLTHPVVALLAGLLLVGLELGELDLHELVAVCQLYVRAARDGLGGRGLAAGPRETMTEAGCREKHRSQPSQCGTH